MSARRHGGVDVGTAGAIKLMQKYDADDSGALDVHEFARLAGTGGGGSTVFDRLYPEPPEEARRDRM